VNPVRVVGARLLESVNTLPQAAPNTPGARIPSGTPNPCMESLPYCIQPPIEPARNASSSSFRYTRSRCPRGTFPIIRPHKKISASHWHRAGRGGAPWRGHRRGGNGGYQRAACVRARDCTSAATHIRSQRRSTLTRSLDSRDQACAHLLHTHELIRVRHVPCTSHRHPMPSTIHFRPPHVDVGALVFWLG